MAAAQEMGKRIVQLRHRQGWTQEQLGRQLNVSGQAVSKWENGDSLPDTILLANLARTLECTTDFLLGVEQKAGLERLLPMLEDELRKLDTSEKIDLAFKLFAWIDPAIYDIDASSGFQKSVLKHGMPLVHAGPHITVWWKGKFLCVAAKEALKETETAFTASDLPFDLFSDDWNTLLTVLLEKEPYFDAQAPVGESSLPDSPAAEKERRAVLQQLMEAGIVRQGRGGFQMGAPAETVLRLLAVLLRAVGKPGVLSAIRSSPPVQVGNRQA